MALITTIAEIKEFAPASLGLAVADIAPFIDEVERSEIKKILGAELFTALKAAYDVSLVQGPASLSPANSALLLEVRRPLIDLALAKYIPLGSVQVNSKGIQEIQTETNRSATKWRTDKLEKSLMDSGYKKLEDLFEFLEDNKDTYPTWATSAEYSLLYDCFVYRASIFNKHYETGNSRRLFIALKAIMQRVENTFIKPVILPDLFDEIKSTIKTVVGKKKYILENYIQPATVLLTIATALKEKSILLDENGTTVFKNSDITGITQREDANDMRRQNLAFTLESSGKALLHNLNLYLKAHIDDFAIWAADDEYVADGITVLTSTKEEKNFTLL